MKETTTITATYKFTKKEQAENAITLTEKLREKTREEEEKKRTAKEFKNKINAIAVEIDNLAGYIETGEMEREYECEKLLDFEAGKARFYCIETHDLIHERDIENGERQTEITDEMEETEDAEK